MPTTFRLDRLDAIAAAEDVHPWFVARRALVVGLVEAARTDEDGLVVDVGCGTGRMLAAVRRPGDLAVGFDLLAGQAHGSTDGRGMVRADVRALPLADGSAQVVLACDVLEHVEQHDAAAAELRRVVADGGVVVVTVPAHRWLWSYRDTDAGHVRRYRRAELVDVLTAAGLEVRLVTWFAAVTLLPLAVLRIGGGRLRRARDLEERPATGPVGRALRRALLAETRWVLAGHGLPFGSSIVAVCRRA